MLAAGSGVYVGGGSSIGETARGLIWISESKKKIRKKRKTKNFY